MTIRHYLDYNATCPLRPEAIDACTHAMALAGNSLSVHAEGRAMRDLVEQAREQVRSLVNAPVNGVVFTSGGTESIHYALNGLTGNGSVKRIFVSAVEHSAVPANAAATGAPVEIIPVRASGVADLDWLRDRLQSYDAATEGGFLVCLMAANNETGVIQPLREVANITHDHGGLFFVDAAQAVGKIPVNFVMSGADLMGFTAHKFGGPVGAGALIAGPNLPLAPVMRGGSHEENRRAGTHNVPAIAGFGAACRVAREAVTDPSRTRALRDQIQRAAEAAGAHIWGKDEERLPGTLCLSADGFDGTTQLMAMDLAGIAVSSGSACSSGKSKPSHVLSAMGADEASAQCAIRVSCGWASTTQDAEAFEREWTAAYERVKAKKGAAA